MKANFDASSLHQMIESVQDAALEPARWTSVCSELAARLGGGVVVLHFNAISPIGRATHLDYTGFGIDEASERSYEEHYRHVDLISAGTETLAVGETAFARCPKTDVERSEFFADWMRPIGMRPSGSFVTVLSKDGSFPQSAIGAYQKADGAEWGNDLIRWMDALAPHVQQALRVTGRIRDLESRNRRLGSVLDSLHSGFALIERDRAISFMNRPFAGLSVERDGIGADRNLLRAGRPTEDRALQDAISRALATERTALPRHSSISITGGHHPLPLVAHVFPIDPGKVNPWSGDFPNAAAGVWTLDLSARRPTPDAILAAAFGLTPAETRTASLLSEGTSPSAIAHELGITVNSAREYTKRVMAKAGANRQPELVKLLRSAIPPGLSDDDL